MYPTTIVEDFFSDPDAIVKYMEDLEYSPSPTGHWPGVRSKHIGEINFNLFQHIGNKIYSLFHSTPPERWVIDMWFQLITPYHEDKWNPLNRGWVHRDTGSNFGGIIYLTKNPEKILEPQFIKRWRDIIIKQKMKQRTREIIFWVMVFQRKSILNHGKEINLNTLKL